MRAAESMRCSGEFDRARGFHTVVSTAEIQASVRALAQAISQDHPPDETLVVVAIMKGALVFLADLIRHLRMPLVVELVNARSYCGTQQGETVKVLDDVRALDLRGRRVLLLDCVLDSGRTLAAVRDAILAQGPASLKTCVLLRKQRPRAVAIEPEYVGLDIPNEFVVGYGLDHQHCWRHLPQVVSVPPEELKRGAQR